MKRIKLVAMIVAIVTVCLMIPSCAELVTYENVRFAAIYQIPKVEEVEKEDGTIETKTTFEDQVLIDVIEVDVSGAEGMKVLDGVIQILETNNIKHKVSEGSITSIKGQRERSAQGYLYVWEYIVTDKDGVVLSEEKRAHEIDLKSGMKIVYTLTGAVDKSIETEATETEAAE